MATSGRGDQGNTGGYDLPRGISFYDVGGDLPTRAAEGEGSSHW